MSYGERKSRYENANSVIIIDKNGAKEEGDENANREEREIHHDLGGKPKDEGEVEKEKENPDDEEDLGDDIKDDGGAGETAEQLLGLHAVYIA